MSLQTVRGQCAWQCNDSLYLDIAHRERAGEITVNSEGKRGRGDFFLVWYVFSLYWADIICENFLHVIINNISGCKYLVPCKLQL